MSFDFPSQVKKAAVEVFGQLGEHASDHTHDALTFSATFFHIGEGIHMHKYLYTYTYIRVYIYTHVFIGM